MENNKTDNEVYAVPLIDDVIEIICKHLDLQDLLNVAQVCKSWYNVVSHEKLRRLRIRQFRLPYEFSNMATSLDACRSTPLFICDSNFGVSSENDDEENDDEENDDWDNEDWEDVDVENVDVENVAEPEHQREMSILRLLKEKRMQKTIVLFVNEYLTIEEVTIYGARHESEFLGYFFPNMKRRTQIRIASIQEFNTEEIDMQVDRLGEELGFDDCEYPKSTLLLFVSDEQRLHADSVIKKLRQRVHSGEQMTWIGIFGEKVIVTDSIDEELYKPIHLQDFLAVKISGPSVESWTTFIYCLAQSDEIESKFQALKQKVKRKKHYAGLVYSPKCSQMFCRHDMHICCNSHEIMRYANRVFPNIPFVGVFQNTNLHKLNSFKQDDGYCLFLYTSIIIISFD